MSPIPLRRSSRFGKNISATKRVLLSKFYQAYLIPLESFLWLGLRKRES